MPTAPAAASDPAPKKRGLFGFLFKSALGCTAFALGALVALILLLPSLVSSSVGSLVEEVFAERCRGSLDVAETKLAWFSPIAVRGASLRDPDGREVARVTVVGPSLRELIGGLGDDKLGQIEIDVDADLVADDAGVTNLARALEPRERQPDDLDVRTSGDDESLADDLARLDAQIVVRSKRIAWSDAETRRAGAPFEVRDLAATLEARPGAPLKLSVSGGIVAVESGKLAIEASIGGPIRPDAPWPFGPIDADVRIEGFSSAMVDGLAGLKGGLAEIFGPRFDVVARVQGATPERGEVALALNAPRASVAIEGRLEGGALRSGEKPFLVASFPAPSALAARFAGAEGLRLEVAEGAEPWTIRVTRLVAPIPPLDAVSLAALAPHLAASELELELAAPGTVSIAHPALAKLGAVDVAQTRVRTVVSTGGEVRVDVDTRALGASADNVKLAARAQGVWARLAANELPRADVEAKLSGIAAARFDPLVAPRSLTAIIGTSFDVTLEARDASAASGAFAARIAGSNATIDVRARLDDEVVRVAGDDRVRIEVRDVRELARAELAALVPEGTRVDVGEGALTVELADAALSLPRDGVPFEPLATATGKLALKVPPITIERGGTRLAQIRGLDVALELSGGTARVRTNASLDSGTPGSFALDATVPQVARLASGDLKSVDGVDVRLDVQKLSTAMLAALAEPAKLAERALGPEITLTLALERASLARGGVHVGLQTANATIRFDGRLEDGVLRTTSADGLTVVLTLPAAVADEILAEKLPAGAKLVWRDGAANAAVHVRELALRVPDFAGGAPFDTTALLEGATLRADLTLAGVGFENELTRAAEIAPSIRDLTLDVTLAPKAPLALELTAQLIARSPGSLKGRTTIADPFAMFRDENAKLAPIDAKLEISGLDPTAIDAFLGQKDLAAGLLGGPTRIEIDARGLSLSGGSAIVVIAAAGCDGTIAARVVDGVLTCGPDEGVELACAPTSAFFASQITPRLPEGTRLTLAEGATRAQLSIRDVRVPLDGDTALLARLAGASARVTVSLPALVYTDAATDAAKRPIRLRDAALTAVFDPSEAPSVRATAAIDDATPGQVALDATALDPLAKLGEEKGLDTFRARVSAKATNVPTAIVDLLAGQDGLLVEALGTRCNVDVEAPDISLDRGAFTASLRSDLHDVKAEGRLDERVLKIEKIDGLVAQIGLGPIGSKRVVGNLVPMLVDVDKPEGATPARFAIDALSYPLDGDLSELDAIVRIDLGEVSYGLLPGLSSFLGDAGLSKSTVLKPITVPITKGIARYEKLPIQIKGKEVPFRGSFNLVDRSFSLGAEVPLALLGKKINAKLDKAREFLPAEMVVPLEIRGTWDKPRVSISKSFLDDVVERALEKGVGDLLDDLFKKKKKD